MFSFEAVTPESVGIPSGSIIEFICVAQAHAIELHSLQILRHGKRCFEGYWAPYNKNTPHILYSFSKSITSTAVGFAWKEGLLALDEKLVDIFPEDCPKNPSENLLAADIFSLLTMSCGHEKPIYAENSGKDWIRKFMHQEFVYPPKTTFQYNTAGTNLLAAIVRKRSGLNVTEYLQERLFDPLGISPVECWKLDDGTDMGGKGMYLTAEAMARFAQFLLNRGSWEGQQLLPTQWFDMAAEKQVETVSPIYTPESPEASQGYGFQFWKCSIPGSFRADGAYGQLAVILPNEDIAIVLTSASNTSGQLVEDLLATIVSAASNSPLPENPLAFTRLQEYACDLAIHSPWGIRNPYIEHMLDGISFEADASYPAFTEIADGQGKGFQEAGHLTSISFTFGEHSVALTAVHDAYTYRLNASFSGKMEVQNILGHEYGISACWVNYNSLLIDTRCTRAVAGMRLIFTFTGETVSLSRACSIPVLSSFPTPGTTYPLHFTRKNNIT